MACCCPHSNSANRFFSFFARNYRKRFDKKGFEKPQKQLMEGLKKIGFQDLEILEIGSGVGYFHQTLLELGAKTAVGVELAEEMTQQAKDRATQRDLDAKTEYISGDFMELGEKIRPSDLTLLDKVVCCYPDAKGLVHQSLNKTNKIYALIYPRNRLSTRVAVFFTALFMKIVGSNFRPYVHDPKIIESWIVKQGFEKQFQNQTYIWLSQIYVRAN